MQCPDNNNRWYLWCIWHFGWTWALHGCYWEVCNEQYYRHKNFHNIFYCSWVDKFLPILFGTITNIAFYLPLTISYISWVKNFLVKFYCVYRLSLFLILIMLHLKCIENIFVWHIDITAIFVISDGMSMQWMGSQIIWRQVSLLYTIQLMKWLLTPLRNKESTPSHTLKKWYGLHF